MYGLHPGERRLDGHLDRHRVHPVDAQAEALDAGDREARRAGILGRVRGDARGLGARLLDVLDQLAGVVELVAEVQEEPERDAAVVGLAQVRGAHRVEERAGARAGDADAARAVEQEELSLAAEGEDAPELGRVERLDAEGGVAEHLEELRAALVVARRVGAQHRVRLEERQGRDVDGEGAADAARGVVVEAGEVRRVLAGGGATLGGPALVRGLARPAEEARRREPVGDEADAERAGRARARVGGVQEAGGAAQVRLFHEREPALLLLILRRLLRGRGRLLRRRRRAGLATLLPGRAGGAGSTRERAGSGGAGGTGCAGERLRLRAGRERPGGATRGRARLRAERVGLRAGRGRAERVGLRARGARLRAERVGLRAGRDLAGGSRGRAERVGLGRLRGGRAGEREEADERERGERGEAGSIGKGGSDKRSHRSSSARLIQGEAPQAGLVGPRAAAFLSQSPASAGNSRCTSGGLPYPFAPPSSRSRPPR